MNVQVEEFGQTMLPPPAEPPQVVFKRLLKSMVGALVGGFGAVTAMGAPAVFLFCAMNHIPVHVMSTPRILTAGIVPTVLLLLLLGYLNWLYDHPIAPPSTNISAIYPPLWRIRYITFPVAIILDVITATWLAAYSLLFFTYVIAVGTVVCWWILNSLFAFATTNRLLPLVACMVTTIMVVVIFVLARMRVRAKLHKGVDGTPADAPTDNPREELLEVEPLTSRVGRARTIRQAQAIWSTVCKNPLTKELLEARVRRDVRISDLAEELAREPAAKCSEAGVDELFVALSKSEELRQISYASLAEVLERRPAEQVAEHGVSLRTLGVIDTAAAVKYLDELALRVFLKKCEANPELLDQIERAHTWGLKAAYMYLTMTLKQCENKRRPHDKISVHDVINNVAEGFILAAITVAGVYSLRFIFSLLNPSTSISHHIVIIVATVSMLWSGVPALMLLFRPVKERRRRRYLKLGFAAFLFIGFTIAHATWFYAMMPDWLGGGRPVLTTIWVKEYSVPAEILSNVDPQHIARAGDLVRLDALPLIQMDAQSVIIIAQGAGARGSFALSRSAIVMASW